MAKTFTAPALRMPVNKGRIDIETPVRTGAVRREAAQPRVGLRGVADQGFPVAAATRRRAAWSRSPERDASAAAVASTAHAIAQNRATKGMALTRGTASEPCWTQVGADVGAGADAPKAPA